MTNKRPEPGPLISRVLLIIEATIGGTRKHVGQICRYLHGDEISLTLVCADRRDPFFHLDLEEFRTQGIEVFLIPMVRQVAPGRDLASIWQLRGILKGKGYDIVHTHSSKAGAVGRIAAKLFSRAKIVHTPHNFGFCNEQEFGRRTRWLFRIVERFLAGFTDALIVISETERQMVASHRIAPTERTHLIVNGIRPRPRATGGQYRERADRPPVLGAIGLLTGIKGQRFLIEAMPAVVSRYAETRCLIVGDGESRVDLERTSTAIGVRDRIDFVGQVEDARPYLRQMDLLVVPSLSEGMPYVILEAMDAGIPVVASRVGGCIDLICDRKTGLLVPPGDVDALGRAILELLDSEERRCSMGLAGRRRLESHFNLHDSMKSLQELYRSLLAADTDEEGDPGCSTGAGASSHHRGAVKGVLSSRQGPVEQLDDQREPLSCLNEERPGSHGCQGRPRR